MVIIRYNTEKTSLDEAYNICNFIKEQLFTEEIIALPQDWDILFNCSTAELYYFKQQIEQLIRAKDMIE